MEPTAEQLMWMYENMVLIREYEETMAKVYLEGKLPPHIQKGLAFDIGSGPGAGGNAPSGSAMLPGCRASASRPVQCRRPKCSQILGLPATAEALAPSLLLRLAQCLSQLEAAPRPGPIPARAVG